MGFDVGLKTRIGADGNLSEIVERLAEAGCDDAVVGISVGFAARICASVSVGVVERLSTLVSLKYP